MDSVTLHYAKPKVYSRWLGSVYKVRKIVDSKLYGLGVPAATNPRAPGSNPRKPTEFPTGHRTVIRERADVNNKPQITLNNSPTLGRPLIPLPSFLSYFLDHSYLHTSSIHSRKRKNSANFISLVAWSYWYFSTRWNGVICTKAKRVVASLPRLFIITL